MIVRTTSLVICPCCGDTRHRSEITETSRIYESGMLGRFAVGLEYSERKCYCGGEYTAAAQCEECGDIYPVDELDSLGYCIGCTEAEGNE